MKEVNEYWQMRIFDLLEGNLSEAEANEVLKEIAQHDALKKEYDGLRRTYLQPDEFVFERKEALYKKSGGLLSVLYIRKYAAAASIAIIFGALSVFWLLTKNNAGTGTVTQNNPKTDIQTPATKPGEKADKLNGLKEFSTTTHGARNAKSQQVKSDSGKQTKFDVNLLGPIHIGDPEFVNQVVFTEPKDTLENGLPRQNIKPQELVAMQDSSTTDMVNMPESRTKKRTLGYRLLNNSRTMLANLQLPSVKFKTEKNPNKRLPKVKMQITTPNTEIIAVLID